MPVAPLLHALAGLVVLIVAVTVDEPVSLGSLLGILLLLGAAVRYAMAREA